MKCFFTDLLNIPFKLHGRDKRGYDCYGLAIEISKRLGHKLIDLPHEYSENNERDLDTNIYNIVSCSKLVKTTEKKVGNIIIFYDTKGRVCHIGVLLYKDDFIHCDSYGVRISNLNSYARKWEMYTWLQ